MEQADSNMVDANDLVYLRERYYDPALGRFPSLDPLEGTMNQPQSLNRYAYVDNNPVNNTDPSGMIACSDVNSIAGKLVCLLKVADLLQNFGISLKEEFTESPDTLENWTSPRVNNVYNAVYAIQGRLGGLTRRAIGDTEMVLSATSPGSEAAVTSLCNKMRLYLSFTDQGRQYTNWIHSVDNIIHEFGHVITLTPPTGRTANSETLGPSAEMANRPVALWAQIHNNRRFDEGLGWENPSLRQHPTSDAAEVVADTFLYWVQGYPFTQDTIGQARSTFINGGDIPAANGNPLRRINDGSVIHSNGIMTWAGNASCPTPTTTTVPQSSLASDPYFVGANNGWCNFA